VKLQSYAAVLAASVMALCAFSHDAKAGSVIIASQNDSDFVQLPGSSFNPLPSLTSGTVFLPEFGSVTDVYRSPFENAGPGNGGVFDSSNGGYQQPGFENLPYTSIEAGASATYSFAAPVTGLSLLWGSPDSYNSITFFLGATNEGSISGSALDIQTYGHDQVSLTLGGQAFNSVFLSSGSSNAFEFADLQATPLPSTWTMLIAGILGLGIFAYRGSKKTSLAIAAA
jgi:hypothetical protein